MAYAYVRKTYGVSPQIGQRVTHAGIKRSGVVIRPIPDHAHYVRVRFDGEKHGSNCHPLELEYHEEAA